VCGDTSSRRLTQHYGRARRAQEHHAAPRPCVHASHEGCDADEHALEPVGVHSVLPVVDGVEGGDEAHPGPLEDEAAHEDGGGVVGAVFLAGP